MSSTYGEDILNFFLQFPYWSDPSYWKLCECLNIEFGDYISYMSLMVAIFSKIY